MWEFVGWFGATLLGGFAGTMLARWQIDRRKQRPDQWMRGYETGMMDATKAINEAMKQVGGNVQMRPRLIIRPDQAPDPPRTNGYDA